MTSSGSTLDAYHELEEHVAPLIHLGGARSILGWDQQVMMPEGGTPARSKQVSTLSRLHHERLTDDRIGTLLESLTDADLSQDESAIVREVRREHERAVRVPDDLVEELAEASAEAHPAWKEARAANDFEQFEPHLQRIVELRREYADAIDPTASPYAVLFAEYEPYISLEKADEVLTGIRETLVPLIDDIAANGDEIVTDAFAGEFDPDVQHDVVSDVLDILGYDWTHGRLDTAPHPFSMGNPYDARVTTRFDKNDVLSAVSSTIHEFGHAHYTLGLPREAFGTPLGQSRDLSVHESQSRLWENHVGRSRSFWAFYLPHMQKRFPGLSQVSTEAAYQSANQVYTDNPIRVEADELTYHLHIVVRYEIERGLISGDLDVADVPTIWNDLYEAYLGLRPATDADGCLQDIHWSNGAIGYFPTYSLGSVLAAQLFACMADEIDSIDDQIREGSFDAITAWLREQVHHHGRRYTTPELINSATGESYNFSYFTDYVTEKYGKLYDV